MSTWQHTPPASPAIGDIWHHSSLGSLQFQRFDLKKQDGWERNEVFYGWAFRTGRPNTQGGLSGDLAITTNAAGQLKHPAPRGSWFGPIPKQES